MESPLTRTFQLHTTTAPRPISLPREVDVEEKLAGANFYDIWFAPLLSRGCVTFSFSLCSDLILQI